MTKQIRSAALAACVVAAFSPGAALAKTQCSPAMPLDPHGYWSWRFIEGRKCWYEGKPMLSKSSLEWAAPASAEPIFEIGTAPTEKSSDPLDSQARAAPADLITFDVLWRARVEQR